MPTPYYENIQQNQLIFLKVRLTNTVVRLEYLPVIEQQGLAVELHVGKLEYRGQAGQV